ncbi:MAG: flagellar basal body P-ring protein FlgI [Magnetococcales bacterium]|nr:flagellar basal body P-ring protein FlgI [Magnetococcales bacterium]MBF0156218.1 flagellar basal body P-ring protein FlgI [Magnetococcales bacterium]
MMNVRLACVLAILGSALLLGSEAGAIRLKDVADIEGVRDNPLTGFGLVVGLNGSGDSSAAFTGQSMKMMLERMGISSPSAVQVKNVASVMVTATLPPFARQGSRLDVTLSSLGDAKSLQGGTLVMTPLKGADGRIYAVAQGPASVGGFAATGAGQEVQKNHPTVAMISGGAIIEREVAFELNGESRLQLALRNPDFTTANRVVRAVNDLLGAPLAKARDSGTVQIEVPSNYQGDVVSFVSRLENLQVEPDSVAKVVVNERTGTIVMGENVRVSTVALSHGNLSLKISENPKVSQPGALSGGSTAVTPGTDIQANEEKARLLELPEGVTLGELVNGLNGVGVTPRDLIAILQAVKAAGALQADLEIL